MILMTHDMKSIKYAHSKPAE